MVVFYERSASILGRMPSAEKFRRVFTKLEVDSTMGSSIVVFYERNQLILELRLSAESSYSTRLLTSLQKCCCSNWRKVLGKGFVGLWG